MPKPDKKQDKHSRKNQQQSAGDNPRQHQQDKWQDQDRMGDRQRETIERNQPSHGPRKSDMDD